MVFKLEAMKERPIEPPSWASHSEYHSFEDREVDYQDVVQWNVDHENRPKIDRVVDGTNHDRHNDNLSLLTGWYKGTFYWRGKPQGGSSGD